MKKELRDLILSMDALKISKEKNIKLSSGKFSDFYFDCKRVALTGRGANLLAKLFYMMIVERPYITDRLNLVGQELGAVPLITAVSMYCDDQGFDTRAIISRKTPKNHGISKWVEGKPFTEDYVGIIIDDVLTTGGSLDKSHGICCEEGIRITDIYVVVDREEPIDDTRYIDRTDGVKFVPYDGSPISIHSIFKKSDFKEYM